MSLILALLITVHCFVISIIVFLALNNRTSIIKKSINFKHLCKDLENENWIDIYNECNPNTAYNNFIYKLKSKIDFHSKINTNKSKNLTKLKPWITSDLIKKIKIKQTICKKLKRSPNNKKHLRSLKILAKEIKIETAKVKESYFLKKFDENGYNSKKNWRLINDIISNNSSQSTVIDQILSNNNVMTTSQEIANSFNDYFVNIGNGLRSQNSVSNEIPIAWCNSTFFLNPITPIELCK